MTKKRSFVYFLGAGASYGIGAEAMVQGGTVMIPPQPNYWSTFLRFCRSPKSRATIQSFLYRYFLGYTRGLSRASASARRAQLNLMVHELVHLLERRRNDRFVTYMDQFMLKLRLARAELNRVPLEHEALEY